MKNLPLKWKMLMGFGVLILFLGGVIAFNYFMLSQIKQTTQNQLSSVNASKLALQFKNMIGQLYSSQADLIINENEGSIAVYKQDTQTINNQLAEIQKMSAAIRKSCGQWKWLLKPRLIFLPLIE